MGLENIKKLKSRFGIKKDDKSTDKYFELIDLIYYEKRYFVEDYDSEKNIMSWSFEDGIILKLHSDELLNFICFVLEISKDEGVVTKTSEYDDFSSYKFN